MKLTGEKKEKNESENIQVPITVPQDEQQKCSGWYDLPIAVVTSPIINFRHPAHDPRGKFSIGSAAGFLVSEEVVGVGSSSLERISSKSLEVNKQNIQSINICLNKKSK